MIPKTCVIETKNHGEQCDALVSVPTRDVIERETDDIVDCDRVPDIGVQLQNVRKCTMS